MALPAEIDYLCSVCLDVYNDPVLLPCSHSFCKVCVKKFWKNRPIKDCPTCRTICFKKKLAKNLALRNVCEAFRQERERERPPEVLCALHGEKLKVFCLQHEQPICWVCRDSKEHANHQFRPLDEVAQDYREELEKSLEPLQKNLQSYRTDLQNYEETAEHIKVQAQHTEMQILEEFKKLHQFLHEEEEARIAALRGEEEHKSRIMKEKIEGLSGVISTLPKIIRAIEAQLKADDISFLQGYSVLAHAQRMPNAALPTGALIDQHKHLGNLSFRVWDKMKKVAPYSPVLLDPNSAHPQLTVSEDLTGVTCGESRPLPDNPERFDNWPRVMGSEGYDSGTHSWDVEVGDNESWILGVAPESMQRKGRSWSGYWRLRFFGGEYTAFPPSEEACCLPVTDWLRRIRVQLNWAGGTLSFSDPDTGRPLYTFTHTFTERMFPYILLNGKTESPMRMLPLKVSVKVHR